VQQGGVLGWAVVEDEEDEDDDGARVSSGGGGGLGDVMIHRGARKPGEEKVREG